MNQQCRLVASTGEQLWEQQLQQRARCCSSRGSRGSSCHSPPGLLLLRRQLPHKLVSAAFGAASLVAHDSCRTCLQQQLGVARGAIGVVRECTHMCATSRHSSKALTQCVGLPVHARMLTTGCALRLACKLYITRAIFCTARPTCTHYTLHLGQ